jgi:hypothetical protein
MFCGFGFEATQNLSIEAGQIPPRGVHEWEGKSFLHWNHMKTLVIGDLVFLSLLNGFVFLALLKVGNVDETIGYWMLGVACLALLAAMLWFRSTQQQFADGKFARWDTNFTAPAGQMTYAGAYHLAYFIVEAWFIGFSLIYLSWQKIGWELRAGIIACVVCYGACCAYDMVKIGLGGGPFADPKRIET